MKTLHQKTELFTTVVKNFFGRMVKSTLVFFAMLVISFSSFAQLNITANNNGNQLAQTLVGSGVTVSNVQFNCPTDAAGSFIATNSNLGLGAGIILTSGNADTAEGPNVWSSAGVDNLGGGYGPLTTLAGQQTYNACVLEFDVFVTADTLKFDYVFGSEEYTTFVGQPGSGGGFNDIFAFFISGPGITGQQNIALLPGTTTPVSINNVNCLYTGQQYYICNEDPTVAFPGCPNGSGCPSTNVGTTVDYDGFTVPLTAVKVVQPCQTYHLILAVADCLDGVLDSGVFIKAGSLSSTGVSILPQSNYFDPTGNFATCVEGCIPGAFVFQLNQPVGDTTTIHFGIGGNAINGVDYSSIPDSVIFYPGDSTFTLNINPIQDNIVDGPDSILLFLFQSCSGAAYDTAVLFIQDVFDILSSNDTSICEGQSVPLHTTQTGGATYSWTPAATLSNASIWNPVATPLVTTSYIITENIGSCTAKDTSSVTVVNVNANAGADLNLCIGDTLQFNASGGTTYSWSPGAGLSATNIPNPLVYPLATTTYYLHVIGPNASCSDDDTVIVNVVPNLQGAAGNDTLICYGQTANLWASGGTTYNWTPFNSLNDPTISNPQATPNTTTTYTVTISNQFGCTDVQNVLVALYPYTPVNITPANPTIYLGESVQLTANGGINYNWNTSPTLSDTTIANPVATPTVTTNYGVTITSPDGCVYTANTTVTVLNTSQLIMPSAFTPNGDGLNDQINFIVRGNFTLTTFSIYNRWGEKIFSTNDSTIGWDGTNHGQQSEIGTYVFVVEGLDAANLPISLKGNITLLR